MTEGEELLTPLALREDLSELHARPPPHHLARLPRPDAPLRRH
jgi:hypothetical protein